MNPITMLIVLAIALVIVSLVSGLSTMVHHGPIANHTGEQWMFRRVGFQALALALIVFAVLLGIS